jgi:hypothetical protein
MAHAAHLRRLTDAVSLHSPAASWYDAEAFQPDKVNPRTGAGKRIRLASKTPAGNGTAAGRRLGNAQPAAMGILIILRSMQCNATSRMRDDREESRMRDDRKGSRMGDGREECQIITRIAEEQL